MSNQYIQMNTEKLHQYVLEHPEDEEAFAEYHSRLNWKTPPKFNSSQEEEQFIKDLVAKKTGN
ncbi:MAG: hypothetical protein WBM44_30270 [Waterburya sp.]